MSKVRDANATWERDLKVIFCDLCLNEIDAGNRPTTHFNREGWSNLMSAFKGKIGRDYNKVQLKNKWDQLKKDWKLWKELKRGATGLGWDPIRKTVDASEDWWKEKLEVLPSARKFRFSAIDPELEEKLDRMFSGVVATGQHAWTPSLDDLNFLGDNNGEEAHGSSDELCVEVENRSEVNVHSRDKGKSILERKRKRGGSKILLDGITSLVSSYETIAANSSNAGRNSIEDAIKILEAMPEIFDDMNLYLFSTTVLEDPAKRKIFIAMAPERRPNFLRFHYDRRPSD